MFKTVNNKVWAFDAEWVPDPLAGRMLYNLPDDMPVKDIYEVMWKKGGATDEDPMPYLKTVQCRIVSIAAIERNESGRETKLHLLTLPRDCRDTNQNKEHHIIGTFLSKVGEYKPQLVGYNSSSADIRAMIQRSIVHGLSMPEFCKRPNKPWEGEDYFDSRNSEASVDLKDILSGGGWGKTTPSLNEIATLSGIPGKMDVDGQQVANIWLAGDYEKIIAYNEFDALSTYLVWLRIAHFGGFFTSKEYEQEQRLVKELIVREIENGKCYLKEYMVRWEELKGIVGG